MYKEIVQALMSFEGRETQVLTDNTTGEVIKKTCCIVAQGPSAIRKLLSLFQGSRVKNPHTHLCSCYGKGKTLVEQE